MILSSTSLLLVLLGTPGTAAPADGAFAAIDGEYQTIRLALLADSTKGVQASARTIVKTATALKSSPTATAAGVPPTP